MPYYNPLSESEYNSLSESDYNGLVEDAPVEEIPNVVQFKAGKVLFDRYGRVSFCPAHCDCSHHLGDPSGCDFPTEVDQPKCVVIRKFDFAACPECVSTSAPNAAQPMELWLDFELWSTDDAHNTYVNTVNKRLLATAQFESDGCAWILSIRCKEGAAYYTVWEGLKTTGKTPVGTYVYSSGCDTSEQVTVN